MQHRKFAAARVALASAALAGGVLSAGLFATAAPAAAAVGPSDPQLACNYARMWGPGSDKGSLPCQKFSPGWGWRPNNPVNPGISWN